MSTNKNIESLGDYSEDIQTILARSIELDRQRNPRLGDLKRAILKNGPRAYKVAKLWTIINEHTQEVHHHSLRLETYDLTKKYGWRVKPDKSINIDDDKGEDEIQKLVDFLSNLDSIKGNASYTIIRQDNSRVGNILEAIHATGEKQELIEQILSWVDADDSATQGLIKLSQDNPIRSKSLAAALNYGRYSHALSEFRRLVDLDEPESTYQKFLEQNHWIFGSEYSELLSVRNIANGIELDFPLRRTLDGYLEVIEIKKPLNKQSLFIGRNLHERSEVSEARTQVSGYLRKIAKENYRLQAELGILVDKVRARVIIGRTGDNAQQDALRLYNADLVHIEIMTYDQLIAIGQRILDILAEENTQLEKNRVTEEKSPNPTPKNMDDIPF